MIHLLIWLFLAVVAGGVSIFIQALNNQGSMQSHISRSLVVWPVLATLVIGTLVNSAVIITAGHVGVVTRFGAVTGTNFEQGLHAKLPFIEEVTVFDVRVEKDQVSAAAASKDLQEVKSTIAVNYHLEAKAASDVFQSVGPKYKERILDPAIQESFKFTTAQFTAEELITQREAVKTKARDFLKERMAEFHIIIDEFNIVNFDFSASFNAAIEDKQVAQQKVEKAKRDLERIKVEADQKIAEAEGQAKAQQLQQSTLTDLYVQFKALEKWDGKLPTVIGGGVPFIQIPTK